MTSHNVAFIDVIGALYHVALNQNWDAFLNSYLCDPFMK